MCVGMAASMGAVLLLAGTKGKRKALPNSRIMIHQPWGGVQGTASDISIQVDEILNTKTRLNEIIAHHSGKSIDDVKRDTDRDKYLSAEEAKAYGIIDAVLSKRTAEPKKEKYSQSFIREDFDESKTKRRRQNPLLVLRAARKKSRASLPGRMSTSATIAYRVRWTLSGTTWRRSRKRRERGKPASHRSS